MGAPKRLIFYEFVPCNIRTVLDRSFLKFFLKISKREVSIQIPGIAFRGVLAVFEVHSRNLVGMELLDHFQSLRGQTCKFWPLRGQNGVK